MVAYRKEHLLVNVPGLPCQDTIGQWEKLSHYDAMYSVQLIKNVGATLKVHRRTKHYYLQDILTTFRAENDDTVGALDAVTQQPLLAPASLLPRSTYLYFIKGFWYGRIDLTSLTLNCAFNRRLLWPVPS